MQKKINKIIFTSTVAVYGFAEPGTDETGAINPFNEYGRTKFDAEEKLRAWQNKSENSLIIVRPTVIFEEVIVETYLTPKPNSFREISAVVKVRIRSRCFHWKCCRFLESCTTDQKYSVYNYIDTPDLTMNELVSSQEAVEWKR